MWKQSNPLKYSINWKRWFGEIESYFFSLKESTMQSLHKLWQWLIVSLHLIKLSLISVQLLSVEFNMYLWIM